MRSVLYAAIATELLAINAYVVPLVGAEHLARNDAPPRMIFVEDADAITMIEGPGGNPRGLFSVVEGSECVIFGESRDHVEGMRDQFLTALHKAVKKGNAGTARGGRYAVTKGGYKRSALIGRNGFEYRLGFGVLVAVVDRKWEAPAPGDPQQAPVASTYTGDQINTYPVVAAEELTASATVGIEGDVDELVEIVTPTPPPDPDP